MSPIPRKSSTILLTEVVEDSAPPSAPAVSPFLQAAKRNRMVVTAVLCTLLLLSLAFVRGEEDSAAKGVDGNLQRLMTENQQLRGRVAELEHELLALQPPPQENAPISRREFVPNGSERDDPFFGPKDSNMLVMVFSDFQCRLCRDFHAHTLPKIRAEYADQNKLKLVYRDFPLAGNQNARKAASFAQCAGEQGAYWKAFDLLNADEKAVESGDFSPLLPKLKDVDQASLAQCLRSKRYESEITNDQADGAALGAQGAPSLFVGAKTASGSYQGVFIRGAQPYPVIKQEIEKLLVQAAR